MKRTQKNSKKFLALLLSLLMTASVSVAFSACDDNTDDTTDTDTETSTDEEVVTDEKELISNSTFTLNPYDATKPIITNTTGWSRATNSVASGVASTSDAASGIIDVDSEKWADLTTSGLSGVEAKNLTEAQAKEKWSTMTTKDKLEYYEAWKDNSANKDRLISDLSFYESFNIDVDDLPLVEGEGGAKVALENPGKPDGVEDTRVLMLHNEKQTDTYIGTAQKYTSNSTVTVKAGETAKFSVWVKTSNLVSSSANNEEDPTAYNRGAYICVNHTVGGKTLEPLEIKNINVNDWTKYEFVLCGSSFADSTFTIVLGLGQSGGSNKEEYVNGYAFFDNLTCEVSKTTATLDGYETFDFSDEEKIVLANKMNATKFALDFYDVGSGFEKAFDASAFVGEATTEKNVSGQLYSTVSGVNGAIAIPGLNGKFLNSESDIKGAINLASLATGDETQQKVYNKSFASDDFLGASDALLFLSKNGAAYKAEKQLQIPVGYWALSFYVKTSAMGDFTGAGIRLEVEDDELATAQEISKIDTTTVVEEDADTDGWQKVLFFFNNKTESTQNATLTLSFGPTSGLIEATEKTFGSGFAAFAKFEHKTLDKQEFECAASGSYSKVVTMEEPEEETQTDSGFDAAGSLEQSSIESGFANAKNYSGVYSDSAFVGGGKNLDVNSLKTAGLLNSQYVANYETILKAMGGDGATWNSVIGEDVTQPLVIHNDSAEATTKTYGFIGASTTISANTYKTVSLRVKVSAGATANIYLVNTDADNYNSTLSIGRKVSYWYDKDGNVCTEDPTGEDFNAKTDIAFRLQKNGLYKVNTNWAGAATVPDKDAYYANLAAYNYDETTKHLYLDDLATDYAYSDNWKHDGNDRIAFYNYDKEAKTAFAYSDNTTKVYDFSNTDLTPRYTAVDENKVMHVSVGDTNGAWKIVTFYIHTGESAKNYRLEVWNGAREGGAIAAGAYVMFDSWNPSDALTADTWNSMIEERKDATDATIDTFDSAFSFFDSAKYFRYDETIDINNVGAVYESYDPTTTTETVAYLLSDDTDMCTVFADYATTETAVSKDEVKEEDEEEEEEDTESETNGWLLASSIAIAAVLVIAIVSLVARKVIAVRRKKHGYVPVKKDKKNK